MFLIWSVTDGLQINHSGTLLTTSLICLFPFFQTTCPICNVYNGHNKNLSKINIREVWLLRLSHLQQNMLQLSSASTIVIHFILWLPFIMGKPQLGLIDNSMLHTINLLLLDTYWEGKKAKGNTKKCALPFFFFLTAKQIEAIHRPASFLSCLSQTQLKNGRAAQKQAVTLGRRLRGRKKCKRSLEMHNWTIKDDHHSH